MGTLRKFRSEGMMQHRSDEPHKMDLAPKLVWKACELDEAGRTGRR